MQHDRPVVHITGAARGVGFAVAHWLTTKGWQVTISDKDADAGEDAAEVLAGEVPVVFHKVDVREESEASACIHEIVERFGRLDALVNNAGIAKPSHGPVEELSLESWRAVVDTNLTGAFVMSKHAVAHLRASKGSIVNIASTRALQSEPNGEPYAASKGGILSLTHALAMSLGPDVRVNSISPGWIEVSHLRPQSEAHHVTLREQDHSQHAAGRVGMGSDIGAAVAFLISPDAGFITAENLVVDGGMVRKMVYSE